MKILLASSEVYPFSKTGGLADMVGALGKSLASLGHQVGIVTPLYHGIAATHANLERLDYDLALPLGLKTVQGGVQFLKLEHGLTIYFIDQPAYYNRRTLYQEHGHDFVDNAERFIFFSKAVAHLGRFLPWRPEVLHLHDWQVGLVPLLIRRQSQADGWTNPPASCFTIHNLAYQGVFPPAAFDLTNLPSTYFNMAGAEFYGALNCLKAGLIYSNIITTVSPRYAREIMTEAFGCGLDGVLRARASSLVGILNGVDYTEWNTSDNPLLPAAFSDQDLTGKWEAKASLQRQMGLPNAPGIPLFGTVTRLADQKGVDIQLTALEEMLAGNMQFVLLGSGSPLYESAFVRLARRYPQKVSIRVGYDHALAHRIEAGCDFYLMPSRFEPCGLNQMYSLKYGTIPIVRVTGGLDDSVVDINEDPEAVDGIKFYEYSASALSKAIRKALVLYDNPELLDLYRRNGMRVNFSWESTSAEYLKVYERARENALLGNPP